MKKTKKMYEKYLNEILSIAYSKDEVMNKYEYLGKVVVDRNYNKGTLGTLLRRRDNIQFDVMYNEWRR